MAVLHVKGPVVVVIYQAGSAKPIMRERPLTNHQLTFQPSPSIPRSCRVYNLGPPLTLKPTAPQFVFSDGKNPKDTVFSFSCLFSAFSWHRSYARESDAAHFAAKGGGGFLLPQNDSSTIRAQHAAEFCGEARVFHSSGNKKCKAGCSIRREPPTPLGR
jgi:hypothetical protein